MADYLTDEEQLDRLRNWWARNGLVMIVAVFLGAIGVVGWRWYAEHRDDAVARASDLYVEYLEASGSERDTLEATLAAEFPESTYRIFVLLRDAKALTDREDGAGALAKLEQALGLTSDDRLADLIRLRVARLQQELDQTSAALETLAGVKSLGFRSQVLELKGDIHMSRGEREPAHEAYTAAVAEVSEGSRRPVLEMKAADTAGANDA